MKTPDEIKKALACDCDGPDCEGCGYAEKVIDEEFGELTLYHCSQIYKDALEYIQQLEAGIDHAEKVTRECAKSITENMDKLQSRLIQVERERDAALKDIANTCWSCANAKPHQISKFLYSCPYLKGKAGVRTQCEHWQWRGVCPENTKER